MPTDLFLQDAPLPSIPDEMVPYLRHILEAAGHSTLWNAGTRTLVIDSPLEGRVIRCEPLDNHDGRSREFVALLQRRIDTAGGIVAEEGRLRPDVTLWISVEPCEDRDRPRVLIRGRSRGWFSRRPPLAEVVGEKLRSALRVPVGIIYSCTLRVRELQVYLCAPPEAFPAIATALWLGLMAYFREGPPVQVPPAPPDFVPATPSPAGSQAETPDAGKASSPLRAPQPHPSLNGAPDLKTPDPKPEAAANASPEEEPAKPKKPDTPPPDRSETAAASPAPSPPPSPEPEQPSDSHSTSRSEPQAPAKAPESQTRPLMRRVPFDEPLPGTVVWSSGDMSMGSRRQPLVSQSPASQPAAFQSTVSQPVAPQPFAFQSPLSQPVASQPSTSQSPLPHPIASRLTPSQPPAPHPIASQSAASQPPASQPLSPQFSALQPPGSQPATGTPVAPPATPTVPSGPLTRPTSSPNPQPAPAKSASETSALHTHQSDATTPGRQDPPPQPAVSPQTSRPPAAEPPKSHASGRPSSGATVQAIITSGNGCVLKTGEQKTERRRP